MKKFIFIAAFFMAFALFTASTSATQVLFVTNCEQSITLRESPSVNGNEIAQIPLGQGVEFVEDADNGFYRVIYGAYTGYALADYLVANQFPENLRYGMLVKRATLFEHASVNSEAITTIISGHWVEYVMDGYCNTRPPEAPEFYLVRAPSGVYGYITADKVDWNYRRRM
ncbi:MAG: SH3 domain-containing protein [Selenomonadaceae bacterium]|nr:SH3 domain-containing protein [Selenomonadaceae bacterium]